MGKINDLKQEYYGDFLGFLKKIKMEDPFSNDVWADKIFDKVYAKYLKACEASGAINQFITTIGIPELEGLLKQKKEQVAKVAQKDVKIIKP